MMDEERLMEWEKGLPSVHDLTPLSQPLIPPELATAFSISPEPRRTLLDVNRASRNTLSILRSGGAPLQALSSSDEEGEGGGGGGEEDDTTDRDGSGGSGSRKQRKVDCAAEEADSAVRTTDTATLKRPRLVWTPQLHKRFVDVVAHLGIKNAVPKTIMQLMNVEGLTRENVASHLQKYRLYLKRMQGLSNEGPSSSDHLFASTPVPQSLHDSAAAAVAATAHSNSHSQTHSHSHGHGNSSHLPVPIPMPYPPPMMSMPFHGMPHLHHGHGHMGMPLPSSSATSSYRSQYPFNMLHQRDWPHPHLAPNDNK